MLSASVIVIVIGQQASDPAVLALQRTLRGVLGADARVQIETAAADPPDQESEAKAEHADGVVELVWQSRANSARIHCFVRRDARWIDREIGFGEAKASPDREALERGRLVGFAVATMFVPEAEPANATEREPPASPASEGGRDATKPEVPAVESRNTATQSSERRAPTKATRGDALLGDAPRSDAPLENAASPLRPRSRRELEFAGIGSVGVAGNAGGVGAMAGARFVAIGPLWSRWFVAGRVGSIPQAQVTTRSALAGTGIALSSSGPSAWQAGLRLDVFACYLDATHFSDDDQDPVRQGRFLGGLDFAGELGWRFTAGTALSAAVGIEALSGKTEVWVHQARVSVIPPVRAIGEFGLRTSF